MKEKFKQWLDTDPRVQIREVQLEVIAEEFAIGFCIWLADEQTNLDTTYKKEHFEELLEIYKKQL